MVTSSHPTDRLSELNAAIRYNKDVVGSLLIKKSKFSTVTLFLLAALQRVESNVAGFRSMVETGNYPVACAVLRMQIDTAMRVYGLRLMADPHDGTAKLIRGERYDRIKPKSGDKLRDAILLQALDREYDWVKRVYDRVSGMVHLSGMHIHHAIDQTNGVIGDDGSLSIEFVIGPSVENLPASLYDELSEAFVHATLIASAISIAGLKFEQKMLNRGE